MGNDNRKGGNGLAPSGMVEPPPLAVEELPPFAPPIRAGARELPAGGGARRRMRGSAAPILFGEGTAAREPVGNDRVLLVGLVWGKETLLELQQVPVGGELRASKLSNLPAARFEPDFRVVQAEGDGHVVVAPSGARAQVRHDGRVDLQVAPQLTLSARYGRVLTLR